MAIKPESTLALLRRLGAVSAWAATSIGTSMLRAVVAARLRQLARTLRHRREAQLLAGLDDHMLADIGANRADLRDAFSQPVWRDPTVVLEDRVKERRLYRRSAASLRPPPGGKP